MAKKLPGIRLPDAEIIKQEQKPKASPITWFESPYIYNGNHYVEMPGVGAVLDDNKLYPSGISLDEWARFFPPVDR